MPSPASKPDSFEKSPISFKGDDRDARENTVITAEDLEAVKGRALKLLEHVHPEADPNKIQKQCGKFSGFLTDNYLLEENLDNLANISMRHSWAGMNQTISNWITIWKRDNKDSSHCSDEISGALERIIGLFEAAHLFYRKDSFAQVNEIFETVLKKAEEDALKKGIKISVENKELLNDAENSPSPYRSYGIFSGLLNTAIKKSDANSEIKITFSREAEEYKIGTIQGFKDRDYINVEYEGENLDSRESERLNYVLRPYTYMADPQYSSEGKTVKIKSQLPYGIKDKKLSAESIQGIFQKYFSGKNVQQIDNNCFIGAKPDDTDGFKQLGIRRVLFVGDLYDTEYEESCRTAGLDFVRFELPRRLSEKFCFMSPEEYSSHFGVELSNEAFQKNIQTEKEETIKFLKEMQKGKFYIGCNYGEIRTTNAALLYSFFGQDTLDMEEPAFSSIRLRSQDFIRENLESINNFYNNLTPQEKDEFGLTEEYQEKFQNRMEECLEMY